MSRRTRSTTARLFWEEHVEPDAVIGLHKTLDRLAACSSLAVCYVRKVGNGSLGIGCKPALFFRRQLDPQFAKVGFHLAETSGC